MEGIINELFNGPHTHVWYKNKLLIYGNIYWRNFEKYSRKNSIEDNESVWGMLEILEKVVFYCQNSLINRGIYSPSILFCVAFNNQN